MAQIKYCLGIFILPYIFLKALVTDKFHDTNETYLNAFIWRSAEEYPNVSDFPESKRLLSKPNTAIAFTGGGSRAYTAAMGYLAGLHHLDLMKNVRYIGGISGGAWATTTYTYVQNQLNDDIFLGPILSPEEISNEKLKEMDPTCARRLTNVALTGIALEGLVKGEVHSLADAWSYGVSKTYLEPVGVVPGKFFSWDQSTVNDIISRNKDLSVDDFIVPVNADRPYPIIGAAIVGPAEGSPYVAETQNYTLIEMTPLYVGQMRSLNVEYKYNRGVKHTRRVGGIVEPFAFAKSGDAPKSGFVGTATSREISVPRPAVSIDLRYAAGASSYAPGSFFDSLKPKNLSDTLGMHFDYWAPDSSLPSAEDTLVSDGGCYENIPLISFLQRRVSKIVLFYVTHASLSPSTKYNPYTDVYTGDELSDSLTAFFGVFPSKESNFDNRTYEYERNQVFSTADYAPVVSALQAAQAEGRGIITTVNLTTIRNDWWGIPAGINAQITFVYLGRLSQWESLLTDEMRPLLVPSEDPEDLSNDVSSGPYRGFPHYFTLGGEINHERANVLADLTGWSVLQNADTFRAVLS